MRDLRKTRLNRQQVCEWFGPEPAVPIPVHVTLEVNGHMRPEVYHGVEVVYYDRFYHLRGFPFYLLKGLCHKGFARMPDSRLVWRLESSEGGPWQPHKAGDLGVQRKANHQVAARAVHAMFGHKAVLPITTHVMHEVDGQLQGQVYEGVQIKAQKHPKGRGTMYRLCGYCAESSVKGLVDLGLRRLDDKTIVRVLRTMLPTSSISTAPTAAAPAAAEMWQQQQQEQGGQQQVVLPAATLPPPNASQMSAFLSSEEQQQQQQDPAMCGGSSLMFTQLLMTDTGHQHQHQHQQDSELAQPVLQAPPPLQLLPWCMQPDHHDQQQQVPPPSPPLQQQQKQQLPPSSLPLQQQQQQQQWPQEYPQHPQQQHTSQVVAAPPAADLLSSAHLLQCHAGDTQHTYGGPVSAALPAQEPGRQQADIALPVLDQCSITQQHQQCQHQQQQQQDTAYHQHQKNPYLPPQHTTHVAPLLLPDCQQHTRVLPLPHTN